MSILERQFTQVYGVRDADPLLINVINDETPGNQDVLIYLLIQNQEGPVLTVGFGDSSQSFTFAFSTLELAENFVSSARKQKLMTKVARILPMTVVEYFDRKKQGWTKSDLCLDPSPEMLSHPNMKLGIHLSN